MELARQVARIPMGRSTACIECEMTRRGDFACADRKAEGDFEGNDVAGDCQTGRTMADIDHRW